MGDLNLELVRRHLVDGIQGDDRQPAFAMEVGCDRATGDDQERPAKVGGVTLARLRKCCTRGRCRDSLLFRSRGLKIHAGSLQDLDRLHAL